MDTRISSIEQDLNELEKLRHAVRTANWRISGFLRGGVCCAEGGPEQMLRTIDILLERLRHALPPTRDQKAWAEVKKAGVVQQRGRILSLRDRNRKKLRNILTNVGISCKFKSRDSGEYVIMKFEAVRWGPPQAIIANYVRQVWTKSYITSWDLNSGTMRLLHG